MRAVFHVVKYGWDGMRMVVDVRHNGNVGALMDAARQYGGEVLRPRFSGKNARWEVVDNDGNLFVAEEQIN